MKIISFLIICGTLLYAESDNVRSTLVFDNKSYDRDHESAYGVTNSYTFLVAKHQIHADNCLEFYYGTMLGLVFENYTADNGFGQDTQQYGKVLKANIGVNYDLQKFQKLSFEGSHAQDELHQQASSQVKLQYQYTF